MLICFRFQRSILILGVAKSCDGHHSAVVSFSHQALFAERFIIPQVRLLVG